MRIYFLSCTVIFGIDTGTDLKGLKTEHFPIEEQEGQCDLCVDIFETEESLEVVHSE